MNQLNNSTNAILGLQLTSTCLGEKILKIFVKKLHLVFLHFVVLMNLLTKTALLCVYNAIVRPYFDYCCAVWDVFGETQSKRLQKLQNITARIIINMSNDTDHSAALPCLGWQPLKSKERKKES